MDDDIKIYSNGVYSNIHNVTTVVSQFLCWLRNGHIVEVGDLVSADSLFLVLTPVLTAVAAVEVSLLVFPGQDSLTVLIHRIDDHHLPPSSLQCLQSLQTYFYNDKLFLTLNSYTALSPEGSVSSDWMTLMLIFIQSFLPS